MTHTVRIVGDDPDLVEETVERLGESLSGVASGAAVERVSAPQSTLGADCVVAVGTTGESFASLLSSLSGIAAPVVAFVTDAELVEVALKAGVADVRWHSGTADQYDRLAVGVETVLQSPRGVDEGRRRERERERIEEFASVVSHDLRDPIQTVSSAIDLARVECDSDHLAEADAALERLNVLVEDLLELARQGQRVETVERVGLAATARSVWPDTDRGRLRLQADLPVVRADRSRLERLFENLFRNAIKYAGPDVTVRVGTLDGGQGFYVADDGPGIPESDRDRVFESGYTTSEDDTGFGLAIVERIAGAHGWTVAVTESENGGARFEVTGVEFVDGDRD